MSSFTNIHDAFSCSHMDELDNMANVLKRQEMIKQVHNEANDELINAAIQTNSKTNMLGAQDHHDSGMIIDKIYADQQYNDIIKPNQRTNYDNAYDKEPYDLLERMQMNANKPNDIHNDMPYNDFEFDYTESDGVHIVISETDDASMITNDRHKMKHLQKCKKCQHKVFAALKHNKTNKRASKHIEYCDTASNSTGISTAASASSLYEPRKKKHTKIINKEPIFENNYFRSTLIAWLIGSLCIIMMDVFMRFAND